MTYSAVLEKQGATVFPCKVSGSQHSALIVGYKMTTYLLIPWNPELQTPPSLRYFLEDWEGQASVVRSPREALEAIGVGPDAWKDGKGHTKRMTFGKAAL